MASQCHQCTWSVGIAGQCPTMVHGRKHPLPEEVTALMPGTHTAMRGILCPKHSRIDICIVGSPRCSKKAWVCFDTRRRHVMGEAYEWQLDLLGRPMHLAQRADILHGDAPRSCSHCAAWCAENRPADAPACKVPRLEIPTFPSSRWHNQRQQKYQWCDKHAGATVEVKELGVTDAEFLAYESDYSIVPKWLGPKFLPQANRHFYGAYVRSWVLPALPKFTILCLRIDITRLSSDHGATCP